MSCKEHHLDGFGNTWVIIGFLLLVKSCDFDWGWLGAISAVGYGSLLLRVLRFPSLGSFLTKSGRPGRVGFLLGPQILFSTSGI